MQKGKSLNIILFFCALFFAISVPAQEKNEEEEIKAMIDSAIEFGQHNILLQVDTSLLLQAITLSKTHQLPELFVLAQRYLGDYFYNNAQYPRAIFHFQTALKEAEHLPASSKETHLLEMRSANSYKLLGRFQDAQDIYSKLLKETNDQLQREGADSSGLLYDKSQILCNIGVTYSSQGDFEKAIPTMNAAYELVKREYFDKYSSYQYSKTNMAFNLGAVYLFKGDGKSAKPYIMEHLDYIKEQNQDRKTIAQTYGNLAYCEYLLKNFDSAYRYYFKSLAISEKDNYPDVSLITYKDLSDTYHEDGKLKNAINYLNKYYLLKDSIQGLEVQQNFDKLRVEFETEQKEQEIIELNQKNQITKQQRWLLIIALAFAIVLGLFVAIYFINLNKNRKTEAELQSLKLAKLNQELEHKKQDLTRLALEISNKQELAEQLSDQVRKVEAYVHPDAKSKWRNLGSLIQTHLQSTDEQKVFHENVEEINHAFFDKLSKHYPALKKSERELCSYIRLGLSNKEIATLRKVSPEAIRSSRFRLRKKLQVDSKEDVEVFLQSL